MFRLLALLLLASCAVSCSPKARVPAVTLGDLGPAPAWKLQDINGREIDSAQFKGKVVVVDFWATWCVPCIAEIPGYMELAKKYGDDLVIVGLSVDATGPAVVRDFVKAKGVTYAIAMADEAVQKAFGGLDVIPTTFLIDRNGRLRHKKVGSEPHEVYEQKILAALKG